MLLLFETAAGLALFKVLNEGKLKESEDVGADFASLDQAQKVCADVHEKALGNAMELGFLACAAALCPCLPRTLRRPPLRVQMVKLKAFSKFQNTTEALEAATALVDSKLSKRE